MSDVEERDYWGRTMLEHVTSNRFHTPDNFYPRPEGKRYSDHLAKRERDNEMSTYVGRVADLRGITELLYEHTYGLFDADNAEYSPDYKGGDVEWRCVCGWAHLNEQDDFIEDHSAHVARVLQETYDIKPREFSNDLT